MNPHLGFDLIGRSSRGPCHGKGLAHGKRKDDRDRIGLWKEMVEGGDDERARERESRRG